MMATDTSIKKDGLCSLTAQKLTEEGVAGTPARNHPEYSAEEFCETEHVEPHMIKMPYPDDENMKRLTHDIKFVHKKGIELKNDELGKVWTNIQHKRAHNDENTNKMDKDLRSKLEERSRKLDEEKNENDSLHPPAPEFSQVQLRKTGSRELLNIE